MYSSPSSYFNSSPGWTQAPFTPGNSGSSSFSNWSPDKEGWGNPSFDKYGIGKSVEESADKPVNDTSKWSEAVKAASQWQNSQQQQSTNSQSGLSGGGMGKIDDNTMLAYPMVIQQPGKSSGGFGGALGTLAGIGASFIPGLGPGIAAAMPAIGGSIGSMFG